MEAEFRFPTKLGTHRFNKLSSSVQSCDFVFVFIAQQHEVTPGNCFRQLAVAALIRLRVADTINHLRISLCKRLILIVDEKFAATRDNNIQSFII